MPTTLNNTQIVFNDGSIQSTAAVGGGGIPAFGAIGTILFAGQVTTSNYAIGSTIAGSDLRYQSSNPTWVTPFRSEGTGSIPQTTYLYLSSSGPLIQRISSGNTGYTFPGGSTALAGTWRNIGYPARGRATFYDVSYGTTYSDSFISLWLRIS